MEMASPLDFRGIQLPNGMDKPGFRDSVRGIFAINRGIRVQLLVVSLTADSCFSNHGFLNCFRALSTSTREAQSVAWSLISPMACMNA